MTAEIHEEIAAICTHIVGDPAFQKDLMYDIANACGPSGREVMGKIYQEKIKERMPDVSDTALFLFTSILFGFLDRKIDQAQSLMNAINRTIVSMPLRSRRADVLTRSYDGKLARDKVMADIQKEWLKEIAENKVYDPNSPEGQKQMAQHAKRQLDIATINALNMHDKDIPKVILDDIVRSRIEERVQEEKELAREELTL